MRLLLASILSLSLASHVQADVCKIVWPNADIPVPTLVRDFILSECYRYMGTTEESLEDCVTAEILRISRRCNDLDRCTDR